MVRGGGMYVMSEPWSVGQYVVKWVALSVPEWEKENADNHCDAPIPVWCCGELWRLSNLYGFDRHLLQLGILRKRQRVNQSIKSGLKLPATGAAN